MIATILGGIGLFLLGMVLLTDGLKAAAGDALRSVLTRFTRGPFSALLSGIGTTALVQSSSATVLTTIGFVSAGLLTFPQAIGVIIGANLGTTSTGWIVSLLGLKLSLGAVALPLVGVGALMRLLTQGRTAALGLALAGFGLIFVGIDVLQDGMRDLSTRIDPAAFPGATMGGRLTLIGVGFLMTVVMQSSSAAVATTLTALHAGTIGIAQGAALVIGQNLGTTMTAALAAIGASTAAKRTAAAHILFNVVAGGAAFALLPLFFMASRGIDSPAVALAAFHTGFNVLGAMLLLPFIERLGTTITRLVPERGPVLTRHLDASVTHMPAIAIDTARRTVSDIAATLFVATRAVLAVGARRAHGRPHLGLSQSWLRRGAAPVRQGVAELAPLLAAADQALAETRRFLAAVRTSAEAGTEHGRHLSTLHAIDHLDRLIEALRERPARLADGDEAIEHARTMAVDGLSRVIAWLADAAGEAPVAEVHRLSEQVASERRLQRRDTLDRTARGELDPDVALEQLEAMRWLDAVVYHVWRSMAHLAGRADSGAATGTQVFHEAETPLPA